MEIAAHVNAVGNALGQAREGGPGVRQPGLVVIGRHAVLGHEDRDPGVLGGQPDRVAECFGVDFHPVCMVAAPSGGGS